ISVKRGAGMRKSENTSFHENSSWHFVMGCSIRQRNRKTTSPMNSGPPSITASTVLTTTGWSSTTPTSRWEAEGAPLIAFRLNLNRDSDKNWSKIASTCSTSFISRNRMRDLTTYDEGIYEKVCWFPTIYFPAQPLYLVGLDPHTCLCATRD